jgi:hypothetical protein
MKWMWEVWVGGTAAWLATADVSGKYVRFNYHFQVLHSRLFNTNSHQPAQHHRLAIDPAIAINDDWINK